MAFEVRTIQQSFAKSLVRETVIRSVKGWTADLVCFLEPNTAVERIISKLETLYGTVSGYHVVEWRYLGSMRSVSKDGL